MKVLGLIPARGASKGVPRKNIKDLCGKPLLAYTAESSLSATRLSRVVLSTEDEEIARVGLELGLDVPFLRPVDLAGDETPTYPVVLHALRELEMIGDRFDAVCLLQPTNPLRKAADIDECIELLERTGADSVFTVRRVPDEYNPKWVYWREAGDRMRLSTGESLPIPRRQELPPAYHRDGSVYVSRCCGLQSQGNLYGNDSRGYEIVGGHHVNIDTFHDWAAATSLLERGASAES